MSQLKMSVLILTCSLACAISCAGPDAANHTSSHDTTVVNDTHGSTIAQTATQQQTENDQPPVGSTDNARVAIPIDDATGQLTFLAGSISAEDLAQLKADCPNLRILQPASNAEALRLAPEAHGADGRYCTPEFMRAAKQLRWLQSPSAGVERYLRLDQVQNDERIVLTNMQGVHGRTIAEHSFAMLLTLTRDIRYYVQPEQRGTWNRNGSGDDPISLHDRTMLVVGLGGIGREVAKIADGFGMHVLATKRTPTTPPDYVDEQGTPDQLNEFLKRADVVALCVPLTDETRGLIDTEEFAIMKPGAFLINVARGPVVNTDALLEALKSDRLAGACLDVTDPEPLTPDHPLWNRTDVIITPHMSSRSVLTSENWQALYLANLRRFANGKPLLNVVDVKAGY